MVGLHGCASTPPVISILGADAQLYHAVILEMAKRTTTTLVIPDSTSPTDWHCWREAQDPPPEWGPSDAYMALREANRVPRPLNKAELTPRDLNRKVVVVPSAEAKRRVYEQREGVLLKLSVPSINRNRSCALVCYSLGSNAGACWLRVVGGQWKVYKQSFQTIAP